jgi:hypothetical protein
MEQAQKQLRLQICDHLYEWMTIASWLSDAKLSELLADLHGEVTS